MGPPRARVAGRNSTADYQPGWATKLPLPGHLADAAEPISEREVQDPIHHQWPGTLRGCLKSPGRSRLTVRGPGFAPAVWKLEWETKSVKYDRIGSFQTPSKTHVVK